MQWAFSACLAGAWSFVLAVHCLAHGLAAGGEGESENSAKQKLCVIYPLTWLANKAEKLMTHEGTNVSSTKGK